jgi:hypothetical protein
MTGTEQGVLLGGGLIILFIISQILQYRRRKSGKGSTSAER